jgi:hypothetical protein
LDSGDREVDGWIAQKIKRSQKSYLMPNNFGVEAVVPGLIQTFRLPDVSVVVQKPTSKVPIDLLAGPLGMF